MKEQVLARSLALGLGERLAVETSQSLQTRRSFLATEDSLPAKHHGVRAVNLQQGVEKIPLGVLEVDCQDSFIVDRGWEFFIHLDV
jgi:hypothetical protein